jgi:hypothetical protein
VTLVAGRAELPVTPVLTKDFSRRLATQMAGPAVRGSEKAGREHGRRFGTSFSGGIRTGIGPVRGILRGFGPGLAAAFGGAAIIGAIKGVTAEAREAERTGKATTAVLKSTGGVANITAKQVEGLATALSNKVGVDDEVIQGGEDMLLTFKRVRNEAGKGNDIFNQATVAAVDLAAGLHHGEVSAAGLQGANILLGKALQDPVKGMTALHRVGIDLNDSQKAQIKTMVAHGDVLGAQKIILGEVTSQFRGQAAAAATAGKRFTVYVNNVKEAIGTALLPIIDRLLGFLVDKLPGAFAAVGAAMRPAFLGFRALAAAFSGEGVTTSATKFVGVMERIGVVLRTIVDAALGAFRRNLDLIKRILPAVAAGLSALLVASAVAKAMSLVAIAIKAIGVAVAANPLGLLLLAVTAVGVGLLWFFRKTETGQRILKGLWGAARALAEVFVRQIVPAVTSAVGVFVRGLMPGLGSLGHVLRAQVLPALKVVAIIIGVVLYVTLTKVLPILLRLAGPVLGFFFKQLGQTIQWISNVIRFIGRLGAWFLRWITGTRTTGAAVAELGRRVGVFAANMTRQWQGIVRSVSGALGGLKRVTVTVLSFMVRLWLRWAGSIIDAAAHALGWVPGIGPKLRRAQTQFHEFAAGVNRALDRIKSKTVNVKARSSVEIAASTRMYLKAANVPGFRAAGGPIYGPGTGTSDSIPAIGPGGVRYQLSNDEHVWTAREVHNAGGHGAVEAIRRQFRASGGPVMDVRVAASKRGDLIRQFYAPTVAATTRLGQLLANKLAAAVGKGLSKAIESGIGGGIGGGGGPRISGPVAAIVRGVAARYGWGSGAQWNALAWVINHESGFNPNAQNPTSTAYGLFQFLNGTWGGVGGHKTSDPYLQSVYGLRYISSRYGTPLGAQAFWQAHHWYDRGGYLQPGVTIAHNNTGKPERVLGPGEDVIDYRRLARAMVDALHERPPAVYLDRQKVSRGVATGQLWDARR